MTNQPEWKMITNLGDANPVDCGGFLVFVDSTGVYPAEAEVWEEPCDDDTRRKPRWTVYRFALERCTYTDRVVSDNKYHPNLPAWFAKDLPSVASCVGTDELELVNSLCSEDVLERARAYQDLISYFGVREFDQYPEQYSRNEIECRWFQLNQGSK